MPAVGPGPENRNSDPLGLNKLSRRLTEYHYDEVLIDGIVGLVARLNLQGMQGTRRLVKKMTDEIRDREHFRDHLIEAWGAELFVSNGIEVRYDPKRNRRGPDLLVASQVYVEVTRIRENLDESQLLETGELVDIPDLTKQIYNKMEEKLLQIVTGHPNLLLIRSSRGFVNYEQAKSAFRDLVAEAPSEKKAFVSGMLFDDGWSTMDRSKGGLRPRKGPRFRLLTNSSTAVSLDSDFVRKLGSFDSPDLDDLIQSELNPTGYPLIPSPTDTI